MKETLNTRARNLRKNMTDAEQKIWHLVRNRRLEGYKFTRQYIMKPYIVDFICREKKLIIELDGGQHAEAIAYDKTRSKYIENQGFKVIRFWNNDVLFKTDSVLGEILEHLNSPSPGC